MAFLPVETVINARQDHYYQQLSQADSRSNCTEFILFLLEALRDALAPGDCDSTSSSITSSGENAGRNEG